MFSWWRVAPVAALVGGALLAASVGVLSWRAGGVPRIGVAAVERLPLSFEPNRGQAPAGTALLARGQGYTLLLGQDRLALATGNGVLAMDLLGARAVTPQAVGRLPGVASYIVGSNPRAWHVGIPTFAAARYRQLWPGIGARFYGDQHHLEYDFDLAPGASAARIALKLPGAHVSLTRTGTLDVAVGSHTIAIAPPRSYQVLGGRRVAVASRWVLGHGGRVRIAVGAYDAARPLVIDPVLDYTAFIGASTTLPLAVAVDATGAAYLTGFTECPTAQGGAFPTTSGAYQSTVNQLLCGTLMTGMGFVSKLSPDGNTLEYSTFIDGTTAAHFYGIAVDGQGDAYLAGGGYNGYPTTPGAYQPASDAWTQNMYEHGVVTELNPTGTALVYSTYLSGYEPDGVHAIALDAQGDAYVTGNTTSSGAVSPAFPTTTGAFQTTYGGGSPPPIPVAGSDGDAFVTELNPTGTGLVYSTFLGGSGDEMAHGIAIDAQGDAYVTGLTDSPGGIATGAFPTTAGAVQSAAGGGLEDAFVTELNPAGSGLVFSTRLGGSGDDVGWGIALDGSGVYAAGYTSSPGGTASGDFPTTAGALQTTNLGGYDAFVTKLSPAGAMTWSTLVGGGGDDESGSIAVDARGDAHISGYTSSNGNPAFPTTSGAVQATFQGGSSDAFVAELNPGGSGLLYSTLLGSNAADSAQAIALDSGDNVYVVGSTNGPIGSATGGFPSASAGVNDSPSGEGAGFAVRLSLPDSTPLPPPTTGTTTTTTTPATTTTTAPPPPVHTPLPPVTSTPPPAPDLATELGLPSATACLSKRALTIHVRAPSGQKLASFTVTLNGRRLKTRGHSSAVSLKGLPKGTFTVQITVHTSAGKTLTGHRTYHTCVKGNHRKKR
jgi:hypothetical protein